MASEWHGHWSCSASTLAQMSSTSWRASSPKHTLKATIPFIKASVRIPFSLRKGVVLLSREMEKSYQRQERLKESYFLHHHLYMALCRLVLRCEGGSEGCSSHTPLPHPQSGAMESQGEECRCWMKSINVKQSLVPKSLGLNPESSSSLMWATNKFFMISETHLLSVRNGSSCPIYLIAWLGRKDEIIHLTCLAQCLAQKC